MRTPILIVDDECHFTRRLKERLEASGNYSVLEENDPRRAVRTAREFLPELILLDVMMPHLDGTEVAAALRADRVMRSVPILFVTALASGDSSADGAESGKAQYIAKSDSLSHLVSRIDEKVQFALAV